MYEHVLDIIILYRKMVKIHVDFIVKIATMSTFVLSVV